MKAASGAPTMADVAARAGVSHQTVSRVLNDAEAVRPETRETVLQAIAGNARVTHVLVVDDDGTSSDDRVRDYELALAGHPTSPIPDERVGTGGSAVVEVAQRREGVVDDVVAGGPAHGRDHGDAARVVLVVTAVEAGVGRVGGESRRGHVRSPSSGVRAGNAGIRAQESHRARTTTAT